MQFSALSKHLLYNLNILRLSSVAKNKIFTDMQTLPKCIRLYGGLNSLRLNFLLITPKTAKSVKISPSKYLGYTVIGFIMQSTECK